MPHKDAAHERPGNQPASRPEASPKPPRAQGRAKTADPAVQPLHGHITHQLDPRQAQPAAAVGLYAPCTHTNTAEST